MRIAREHRFWHTWDGLKRFQGWIQHSLLRRIDFSDRNPQKQPELWRLMNLNKYSKNVLLLHVHVFCIHVCVHAAYIYTYVWGTSCTSRSMEAWASGRAPQRSDRRPRRTTTSSGQQTDRQTDTQAFKELLTCILKLFLKPCKIWWLIFKCC